MNGEASRGAAEARRVRRVVVPWCFLALWTAVMAWCVADVVPDRARIGMMSVHSPAFERCREAMAGRAMAGLICLPVAFFLMPVVVVFSKRGVLVARGFGLWRRRAAWEEVRHVVRARFGRAFLVWKGGNPLEIGGVLAPWEWRRCERLLRERGVEVRGVAMATRSVG